MIPAFILAAGLAHGSESYVPAASSSAESSVIASSAESTTPEPVESTPVNTDRTEPLPAQSPASVYHHDGTNCVDNDHDGYCDYYVDGFCSLNGNNGYHHDNGSANVIVTPPQTDHHESGYHGHDH